ncbi:MAG: hypothetical protein L6R38_000114 [Xanthoria sp. 2 TBL-2021]|nr:MAG: hypothetical protein L6R38_000114 [Xanthoria sp. 2 TBL-2021]
MAGASDKARYFLEQSVPELQELLRKKIFTKDEVSSIAKKRSEFEHKLSARGSTASDYARYVEYEMNLDALRRTRAKRLGIKATSYTGQRRIFFVLDRATQKFHGDTSLWMLYLSFARKQKANKKVAQIITNMLRLHPASPELWIYAANYAWEERADITETRGYMQRGLRFCNHSKRLWSEYLKLEMIYIAKISARRRILGLDSRSPQEESLQDGEDFGQNLITLSHVTTIDTGLESITADSARPTIPESKIASTPALAGAIPITIFAAAMKEFQEEPTFGTQLFDCVAEFHELDCAKRILQHMVQSLMAATPTDAATLKCFIREPLVGLVAASTLLPRALIEVVDRFELAMRNVNSLKGSLEQTRTREAISQHTIKCITTYLEYPELDPDIRAVLTAMIKTAWAHCLRSLKTKSSRSSDETIALLKILHLHGFKDLVQPGVTSALSIWPDDPQLLAIESPVILLEQRQ